MIERSAAGKYIIFSVFTPGGYTRLSTKNNFMFLLTYLCGLARSQQLLRHLWGALLFRLRSHPQNLDQVMLVRKLKTENRHI